jgi:hypothetical protein
LFYFRPTSSDGNSVDLIVGGDVPDISSAAVNVSVGVCTSVLELSSYSLPDGLHTLTFYTVNGFGFISNGFDVTSLFIPGVTASVAKNLTFAATPLASETPARYPSAHSSTVPIRIVSYFNTMDHFDWLTPSSF